MTSDEIRPDCIIVGGGAAGLSAALLLGRARRSVLLIDAGEQSNLPAHGIGGLLGHDGRPPGELYALGRAELAAYPSVTIRGGRVAGGRVVEGGFALTLADGDEVTAPRVLLATGMRYAVPDLPGFAELWGGAVFHCPYCHGWEARDGALAVMGSFGAAHRALLLRGWSDDVGLLTDGPADLSDDDRALLAGGGVPIDERPVAGVRGRDGRLEAVLFADGTEMARDGLMAYAPMAQRSSLAADLGAALTGRGTVDVDSFGQTTVPGLYAAGDTGTDIQSMANVIAEGARAAVAINVAIVQERFGVVSMIPPRAAVAAG